MSDHSNVAVILPTILRRRAMERAVESVRSHCTSCKIIGVDDSPVPYVNEIEGIDAVTLPFDSGLSVKRNVGARVAAGAEYLLIADDDTTFVNLEFSKLKEDLKTDVEFLVPSNSGTLRSLDLERERIVDGPWRISESGLPVFHATDNVLFGKRTSFLDHPWVDELKCGEHATHVYNCALQGVGFAPSTGMNYRNGGINADDGRYGQLRARARSFSDRWFASNTKYKRFYPFGPLGKNNVIRNDSRKEV